MGRKVLSAIKGLEAVDCNGTDAQAQQIQRIGEPCD
jgi:hypothetical protein